MRGYGGWGKSASLCSCTFLLGGDALQRMPHFNHDPAHLRDELAAHLLGQHLQDLVIRAW